LLDCFVYIYNDIFEGKSFDDMTLDELNEREDDIDEEEERIFEAYRFVYMSRTQRVRIMVLNSTFNNISVIIISWRTCQSLTVC
jgi:hypothetical protein